MPQVGKIIGGAALIAGAVALDVATGGAAFAAGAEEFTAFLAVIGATGASLIASGTEGLLATPPPGHGTTSNNPIQSWQIAYGSVLVPGSYVYLEDNGGILTSSNPNNKCNNQVIMLAAHPIKSVQQVRFNGRVIPLGPGGSGAQSTQWTYTPSSNQNQTNITSISRAGGVVTLKLAAAISGINGQQINIQNVGDRTFNGIFTVAQTNPADATTFTYLCGGADASSSGGYVQTTLPDWKNRVHADLTSCLGNHTSTFPELLSTSNIWTEACKNLGRASVYIAHYWDSSVYANGLPTSSFVIEGYNNIYDPRLGDVTNPAAYGYTQNAALIIADYLCNSSWGYGLTYGTDVPLSQLIAAANLADEDIPLAAGGTEKRYTINMTFNLSRSRGEVLQDMLNACAGRISWQSGQFIISPGAWVGPSLSLTQASLIGAIEYKPSLTITDAYNGVKGTYTSAASDWQPTDLPPYCEDQLHGYDSDRWLAVDNGSRLWKDVSLPATTSVATGQRLLKIDLERIRREGRGTLHCDMSAYPAVALDVIDITHPRWGWNNKTFEVLSSKFVMQSDANGGAPTLGVDLDIAETDSDIYDWSTSEELTHADTVSPAIGNGQAVLGPQTLVIESGPSTTYVGHDGIALPRILAGWEVSPDIAVQQGGYVVVEYQKVGDTYWTPAGTVGGSQTQCYISGVVAGQDYSVQVQAFTAKGVSSSWAEAGPITCSATSTFMSASNLTYPDGTPIADLEPAQAGADMTAAQALAYTGMSANLIPNGAFILGNIDGWVPTQGAAGGGGSFNSGGIGFGYQQSSISPTFNVVPGQKYRFSFSGNVSAGGPGQHTYHRLFYAATYSPNIGGTGTLPAFIDLLSDGSIPGEYVPQLYDWTCPAGIFFASLAVYNLSSTIFISYNNISAQDYGAAGEWPIGGGNGTVATIVNQGDLATLSQVGTVNLVANAVNSVIVYSSSDQHIAAAFASTVLAQATVTTAGGYIKIRCTMEVCTLNASTRPFPGLNIRRGGATGPSIMFYGNLFVTNYISTPHEGFCCIAIEAVDVSPNFGLVQQYTVTMENPSSDVYCDGITLVIENAKK